MSSKLIAFCFFLTTTLVFVDGWGFQAHALVARLAQSHLNDDASAWVKQLIPWHWNGSLASMSSWADTILHNDSNPTGYPNWQWTRPHHFINIPDWSCVYQRERDCVNDHCIHGAIENYTRRLTEDLPETQHQEALYFLIHHLGDIHQPLHTAFAGDYGGNSVKGFFMNSNRSTNLHTLWDTGLIAHRLSEDFAANVTLYYDYLYQLMLREYLNRNDTDDIEQWINENLQVVCAQIYLDENNEIMNRTRPFRLGREYYQRHISIVEERLVLAGVRLTRLLNRLAARPSKTIFSTRMLIIVLIFVLILLLLLFLFIGLALKYRA